MEENVKKIGYCGWDVLYLLIQKIFSLPALLSYIIIIGVIRIPKENVGTFIKESLGFLANNNILILILISFIVILLIFIFALWKIKNAEINRVASERNFYQEKFGVITESSESSL